MRFFIALEIPEASRHQLEKVQKELQALVPQIRLTENHQLHLTIAFIGEQPERILEPLEDVLKNAANGIEPFSFTPAYLDGFPTIHRPHTLWVGVKGDVDKLFILRERVKDGLLSLELDVDERRFIPHIAVAKPSPSFHLSPHLEQAFESIMNQEFVPIQVNAIKLFESVPDNGFHRHNTLLEIPLRK